MRKQAVQATVEARQQARIGLRVAERRGVMGYGGETKLSAPCVSLVCCRPFFASGRPQQLFQPAFKVAPANLNKPHKF